MPPLKPERYPGLTLKKKEELEVEEKELRSSLGRAMDEIIDSTSNEQNIKAGVVESKRAVYQTEDQLGSDTYTWAWLSGSGGLSRSAVSLLTERVSFNEDRSVKLAGDRVEHFSLSHVGFVYETQYPEFTLEELVALWKDSSETVELIQAAQSEPQLAAT